MAVISPQPVATKEVTSAAQARYSGSVGSLALGCLGRASNRPATTSPASLIHCSNCSCAQTQVLGQIRQNQPPLAIGTQVGFQSGEEATQRGSAVGHRRRIRPAGGPGHGLHTTSGAAP